EVELRRITDATAGDRGREHPGNVLVEPADRTGGAERVRLGTLPFDAGLSGRTGDGQAQVLRHRTEVAQVETVDSVLDVVLAQCVVLGGHLLRGQSRVPHVHAVQGAVEIRVDGEG